MRRAEGGVNSWFSEPGESRNESPMPPARANEGDGTKLGLFGGSFDPPHIGHRRIAEAAAEGFGLDRVVFIPAGSPPLKEGAPEASAADRLAMVRRLAGADARFEVSTADMEREGPCYTVDTVEAFARARPGASLFWILGADQVALLPRWRKIEELAARATFLAFARPGHRVDPPAIPGLDLRVARGPEIAASSTEIRDRVARGEPVAHLAPPEIDAYISSAKLYRRRD